MPSTIEERVDMDNNARIELSFRALQDLMPGYVFTLLECLLLRQQQGDSVYMELEALLQGLHEDGEMESADFEEAMGILEEMPAAPAAPANSD